MCYFVSFNFDQDIGTSLMSNLSTSTYVDFRSTYDLPGPYVIRGLTIIVFDTQ